MASDPIMSQQCDLTEGRSIFSALRNALAALYPVDEDARLVVDDAGLAAIGIAFSSRAQTNWHNILVEAVRQGCLDILLRIVLSNDVYLICLLPSFCTKIGGTKAVQM